MDFTVEGQSFFFANAGGGIDILHTFGPPQDGTPVFDLPQGFTANSVSLGIVNNVVPGPAASVPGPAALALLVLGALTVVACRRKAGRAWS